nr:hypothetical protein [Tanacetum cinerariifolium]
MLVAMPFHNFEIRESNDPSLGVYIKSKFSVNSEPVELLTFLPLVTDSPKGMLVIVYRLLCSIFATRGTSSKILEVVVDEMCKRNYTTTSLARSCSNHDSELEVSSAEKTIQDAEKIKRWSDHLHLFQTPDIRVCPSER